ncbi:hypothetical protein DFA_07968 [Cavenderia fasciculata]|uniref:Uncharacterized protein n=1 Tax=Cavenderia fasciculata TaxID=261658 RepID=F4Q4C5_CACFS|nr:uncharacterized protein DFA_07968 [Cavenderia fasciculata]EGG16987.1 hypothetical protein DFA_07968 [Cavenderia fasciculata]|eukprot:XP_004355471.1 hypothetical protein DFA_07968 [Cavenderia fasciculata]
MTQSKEPAGVIPLPFRPEMPLTLSSLFSHQDYDKVRHI